LAGGVVILAASAIISACGPKPNFSGVWLLDTQKSEYGAVQPPDSNTLTIIHDELSLRVLSVQKTRQVETSKEITFTANGAKTQNRVHTADGDREVTAFSRWDGQQFTTTYQVPHGGHFDECRDLWNLSNEGKVLTIRRSVTMPDIRLIDHRYSISMVFSKGRVGLALSRAE